MSRFEQQLERGLRELADRGTPSANAWQVIQDRIARQTPSASAPQPHQEYVVLVPNPRRPTVSPRVLKIVLAAAACLALFVVAALLTNHPNSDLPSNSELNDVDLAQATALGQSALVRAEDLGTTFRKQDDPIAETLWAQQAAMNPACAVLPSFGLAPPTTKAAFSRQWLNSFSTMAQNIMVFATAADASQAMDQIAGSAYAACDRELFDRLTPYGTPGATSITETWPAPAMAPHGDRQIIIGQHTTYSSSTGSSDEYRIGAYIQVGRAISWINPVYVASVAQPLFLPDKVISASAAQLENVFGRTTTTTTT